MLARDIMTRTVVTVTATTGVAEAATLLASRGFTALPVVDGEGTLIGLPTEITYSVTASPTNPASTAPTRAASSDPRRGSPRQQSAG